MKDVDKPSECAEPLQSLWQSACILINIPNDSFPMQSLHRQQKKEHNTVSPAMCLTVLAPLSFRPFLCIPNPPPVRGWSKWPTPAQHFSHVVFLSIPATKPLTHTSSLFNSTTSVFLTGMISPFAGLSGCCSRSHLSYSGYGIYLSECWPVSLVLSEEP